MTHILNKRKIKNGSPGFFIVTCDCISKEASFCLYNSLEIQNKVQ